MVVPSTGDEQHCVMRMHSAQTDLLAMNEPTIADSAGRAAATQSEA